MSVYFLRQRKYFQIKTSNSSELWFTSNRTRNVCQEKILQDKCLHTCKWDNRQRCAYVCVSFAYVNPMYANSITQASCVFSPRVPSSGELRQKWIAAIEEHQIYDHHSLRYYVCMLHFDPDCGELNKANIMKNEIVPSIFVVPEM